MKKSPPLSVTVLLPVLILSLLLSSCKQERSVSLKTLLLEMVSREEITRYPSPHYTLRQFSSYDRASVSRDKPGWFANADYTQFLAEETKDDRKEYVLFESDGPGAIVRWWMTFAGEGSYSGIVRVYIDNDPAPVIQDSILKVLSGHLLAGEPLSSSVSPLTPLHQRGHNLYLPLPYSKHCKITYESNTIKISGKDRSPAIYYNICYRAYDKGTRVIPFSMKELDYNSKLIEDVCQTLLSPPEAEKKGKKITSLSKFILQGDSAVVYIPETNYAISRIRLTLKSENYPQALRSTVLSITFDGINTVWVPAGEFFGTGYMRSSSKTWYSDADTSGSMSSWWLMPFRESCSVKLINYAGISASADLTVECIPYKWEENSMYFGAAWHEYNGFTAAGAKSTGGSGKHIDLSFVELEGQGVYAGDAITIFNTADAWFGEGDEKIYVDGEQFPSSIGTGTEDYYGYAWCRPEIFTHPFIAQPSGKGNFNPGQTINMRYRSLDAIPFTGSISSNIELWHWVNTIVNYSMTSYWYALPGYYCSVLPSEESVRNKVPLKRSDIIIPETNDSGTIEGESLDVAECTGGITETQSIASVGWSNGGQIWWRNGKPGDKLKLRFISKESGLFNIKATLTRAVDYGIIEISVNDNPRKVLFNGYIDDRVVPQTIDLGSSRLNKGDNFLNITIIGKDKNAKPGYMAGIDIIGIKR